MTYYEVAIQIETDESLNQVNSKILAALFAADIDAAGVQVEEFETTPVYEVSADEFMGIDYDEVQSFGSNEVIRYPTYRASQEDYVPHPQLRSAAMPSAETLADVPDDSYTAELLASLKEAHKRIGDRHHG